jgi:hypothetical protein
MGLFRLLMLLNVIFKPFFAPDVHAGRISSLNMTETSEVHMSMCVILLRHILNLDIQGVGIPLPLVTSSPLAQSNRPLTDGTCCWNGLLILN